MGGRRPSSCPCPSLAVTLYAVAGMLARLQADADFEHLEHPSMALLPPLRCAGRRSSLHRISHQSHLRLPPTRWCSFPARVRTPARGRTARGCRYDVGTTYRQVGVLLEEGGLHGFTTVRGAVMHEASSRLQRCQLPVAVAELQTWWVGGWVWGRGGGGHGEVGGRLYGSVSGLLQEVLAPGTTWWWWLVLHSSWQGGRPVGACPPREMHTGCCMHACTPVRPARPGLVRHACMHAWQPGLVRHACMAACRRVFARVIRRPPLLTHVWMHASAVRVVALWLYAGTLARLRSGQRHRLPHPARGASAWASCACSGCCPCPTAWSQRCLGDFGRASTPREIRCACMGPESGGPGRRLLAEPPSGSTSALPHPI